MNVMNMFEENDPPVMTKPTLGAKPAFAFTPDLKNEEPITELPGDNPYVQPQMQVVPQEPTREDEIKARMEEYTRMGYNPLAALIDKGTPVIDEKKQQRLKFAAGVNALGQGLSTLVGGYYGAKGGPILPQENTFTPAALQEYSQRIDQDKEAKYRNAMSKAAIAGDIFKMATNDVNQERNINTRWMNQAEINKQRYAALQAIANDKKGKGGLSAEDQITVINAKYDRMAEIEQMKSERMRKLETQRQSGRLSQAEFFLEQKKLLEEYKANIKSITEETETYTEEGAAKKTKTETKVAPPVVKPTPQKQSTKSKGKYEIQTW